MSAAGYVIVGAGIAGACIADQLSATTDETVVVVDRGTPMAAMTAHSFGLFGFYGDDVQRRMKAAGLEYYNRLLAERGDAEYTPLGRLEVATTADGASDLEAAAERASPGEVAFYAGAELPEQVVAPFLDDEVLEGVLHRPAVGAFDPGALGRAVLDRARRRGADVRADTPVTGMATDGGWVTGVETAVGTIEAETVVCAAGPWTPGIVDAVGVELPLRFTYAPSIRLRPEPPLGHVVPNVSHLESGHSFRGRADGSILLGHKPADGWEAGGTIDPGDVGALPDDLRVGALSARDRLFPRLADVPVESSWVGLRGETPDGNPLVGPTDVPGLSVATFADSGIQLAPAAAATIAGQLTGADSHAWDAGIDPTRFGSDA